MGDDHYPFSNISETNLTKRAECAPESLTRALVDHELV